jgi:host factor-I protein
MSNRKLIRPSLADIKDQLTVRPPRPGTSGGPGTGAKRPSASDQTNAENFYYVKQMQNKTPMVVVLQDGETIKGSIEWYDRNSIKVNRSPEPSLLLLKHYIKYMYKENEDKEVD